MRCDMLCEVELIHFHKGLNYMKKLAIFTLIITATVFSKEASAGLLCEARLLHNGSSKSITLTNQREARPVRLEGQIEETHISVLELAAKAEVAPTLQLTVKNLQGIILWTMLPAPGVASGNAFVRTDLKVQEGYLVIKCIEK